MNNYFWKSWLFFLIKSDANSTGDVRVLPISHIITSNDGSKALKASLAIPNWNLVNNCFDEWITTHSLIAVRLYKANKANSSIRNVCNVLLKLAMTEYMRGAEHNWMRCHFIFKKKCSHLKLFGQTALTYPFLPDHYKHKALPCQWLQSNHFILPNFSLSFKHCLSATVNRCMCAK